MLIAKNRLILRAEVKNLARKNRKLPFAKFRIYVIFTRDDVQILKFSPVFKYLKILKFYLAHICVKLDANGICRDLALGEGVRDLAAKIWRHGSGIGKFNERLTRAGEIIKFSVFYF